jgi:superfamily I DNA/RNA helicase
VLGAAAKAAIKQFMTSMDFLGQCLDTTSPSSFIGQVVTGIRYKDYLLESE